MVERKVPRRNAPGQGRPKRPTNLRVVDGGARARPTEPQPDERRVVMPAGMSAEGQRIWKRLAPGMIREGVLTFWDVDVFRIYCEALSRAKEARVLVDEHGLLVPGRGGLVTNPAVRIERDQMRLALQVGARFGLTPSDRAGLSGHNNLEGALSEFMS